MTRRFEGRPLPRPHAELVDQGLGFDLGTLLTRRQALRAALGLGAVAGLAACTGTAREAGATNEIPDETPGPFPAHGADQHDVLEQSGVVRRDLRSSFGGLTGTAEGVPMELALTVTDLAAGGAPYAGVAVYVWQCDREARYSLYDEGALDQNYLRGVQVADAAGRVAFTSIVPACYPGRWPHVHLEVYPDLAATADPAGVLATSQLALPQEALDAVYATSGYERSVRALTEVSLRSDLVFRDDGGVRQLATVTGDVRSGLTARLAVPIDRRTPPR